MSAGELPYFPRPYPGELLYSVLARAQRHMGLPSGASANRFFFGVDKEHIRHDYPTTIDLLVRRIPESMCITAETLIVKHTMFPYYVAMFGDDRGSALFSRMRSTKGSVKSRLSSAFVFGSHLRFCPDCLRQMMGDYGEAYWVRGHQIPAVLMCPIHGCVLRLSSVRVIPAPRTYVAATTASCGDTCVPVHGVLEGDAVRDVLEVARRLTSSIDLNLPFDRLAWRAEVLESVAGEDVAVRGGPWNKRVSKARIQELFEERMGHLTLVWPSLFGRAAMIQWVKAFDATSDVPVDPAQRVLLSMAFSGAQTKVNLGDEEDQPCLNPIVDHHGERTARFVKKTFNNFGVTNAYRCDCGFSYTVLRRTDGSRARPKFRPGGRAIKALLGSAGRCRFKAEEVQSVLGVSLRTLGRMCEQEGIDPWWTRRTPRPVSTSSIHGRDRRFGQPISSESAPGLDAWSEGDGPPRRKGRVDAGAVSRKLTDAEWDLLSPLVSRAGARGRARKASPRALMDGILYVFAVGCAWEALPDEGYPPTPTVYYAYRRLRADGFWDPIWARLLPMCLERQSRDLVQPAISPDSQTGGSGA